MSVSESLRCRITCPECGQPIREPFFRASGPVMFTHRRYSGYSARNKPCRIVVWPDPQVGGTKHRAWKVRPDQRMEDVHDKAIELWVRENGPTVMLEAMKAAFRRAA